MRCFFPIVAASLLSLNLMAQAPDAARVAAPTAAVLPASPLLPQTFGAWKQTAVADAPKCDGAACVEEKEFGLKRASVATYERTDGRKTTLTVRADDMMDATGAFSAFTVRRGSLKNCAANAKLGHDCVLAPGHLIFWQGETVVDIGAEGSDPIRLPELQPLVDALPKPGGTKGALPLMPQRLPADGLDRESIRYAVGAATFEKVNFPAPASEMGFDKSAEVVTAMYHGKPGAGRLAIFYYPTNQIAADRQGAIEKALAGKVFAVRRIKNTLAVAYGGFTEKQAKALVAKVQDHETLTMQNSSSYEPPALSLQTSASIMVKIVFFVGFMTLAAAVLGIFFGGGRALIRKMQGKPVSSLADMEVIKLNIGGKPETKLQYGSTDKESAQGK